MQDRQQQDLYVYVAYQPALESLSADLSPSTTSTTVVPAVTSEVSISSGNKSTARNRQNKN